MTSVAQAVADGVLPGRVWFYSNYHCNLTCEYCLTESSPSASRRQLDGDLIRSLARQAVDAGFTSFGVTGGEPFLRPDMVELLLDLSALAPTIVLSNGTVFGPHRLDAVRALAGCDVAIQVSLDAPEPDLNDEIRGPENFAVVSETVPKLIEAGLRVRIATTMEPDRLDEDAHARLCALHRSWGIPDDDHLTRTVIHRGRARDHAMGIDMGRDELPAELCLTVDGAFWSPFGPTVHDGRTDTDLLITRTIDPIATPARALLDLVGGLPPGHDARTGIR